MQPQEYIAHPGSDDITCLCGNTPASSGFGTYTAGKVVEPTPELWNGCLVICLSCGRVIDQTSGEVLTQRPQVYDTTIDKTLVFTHDNA